MLERLGFCAKLVGWIKQGLESSSLFVLVNESSITEFKPKNGLRQGIPLHHFYILFLQRGYRGQ